MTLKGRILAGGVAAATLVQTGWGQPASPWRAYKMADGLAEPACSSITIGPRGTVLARHIVARSLTKMDGYGAINFPAPPNRAGRVFDSPAGQLWAAGTNGVFELRDGQWTLHRLPAGLEGRSTNLSSGSIVALHPVRQGRVLLLQRDNFVELNIASGAPVQVNPLRSADQTRIGPFYGLTTARDGGLWISGARGLAKIPPTPRTLRADTVWEEFELPETWTVGNLHEPREDLAGAITAIAEAEDRNPVIVRFDGQAWTTTAPGAEQRVRFAWSGSDQTHWAATTSTLLWRRNDEVDWLPNEDCPAHKYFDMAMEPNGAFWLATLDGLFRYAPATWRTPPGAEGLGVSVHCLAGDAEGRVWFVSGGELHSLREGDHRIFPFPETIRRSLQMTSTVVPLFNGMLLFEAEDRLFTFAPLTGDFVPIGTANSNAKLLGLLNKGSACVLSFHPGQAGSEWQLGICDGDFIKPFPISPPLPFPEDTIISVFHARSGDLWFSVPDGMARLREGKWETYLSPKRLAPRSARLMTETLDGRIWCAAEENLWAFDGSNWLPIRTGFGYINALARGADDVIWVASNVGLHRLAANGWIENGVDEGLPNSLVRTLCVDRRGRLWAGTSQGLSVFHPEADTDPPETEIYTPSDQPLSEGASLTIGFSGQDKWKFTPRNRLLYSHRLDDRDWSSFQDLNTVTLGELSPGQHSFQIRCMDRNGNVERKPAELAFVVTLPWFKETRLLLIAAMASTAVIFFAALAFNRHLRLRRSYTEVERKIAERTQELELASRELLHSQKMNALGTLAAGIAHDFNNILSIIKGSAQIIEDNLDDPMKIRTRLDRIKIVVEQGAGTVQAMLGFSRNSDGNAQSCDLSVVLNDTVSLLGDRFLHEVDVKVEAAPALPPIPVAKDHVQQILLNFIFNAAESMNGPKRVILSAERLYMLPADIILKPAESPGYISVSVQDFGCGIPTEILPRIFEPFFTTKAMSSRRGTGLGLSMAYELARRMNAGLAVKSIVGQGSTFALILPSNGSDAENPDATADSTTKIP